MSDNASNLSLRWKRPSITTNVWRVKESCKHFRNGKPVKFSIQEIPKDRYEDVLDHMCEYFLADEPLCSSSHLKDDPQSVEDCRKIWRIVLNQGISVGAFILGENGEKPFLAGTNIIFISTKEDEVFMEQILEGFKSSAVKKVFSVAYRLHLECDMKDIYKVDQYMSAFGLSVHPSYRGEKLGLDILQARDDIGRKYGITATVTLFTAPASQSLAEQAGFTVHSVWPYEEILDDEGNIAFPLLKTKVLKIMHKKLI